VQELRLIESDQINLIPFEGSWTAGQLAQHMIMSNGAFAELLNGPVEETDRDPGELIEKIKSTFLNFDRRFESPEFITPPQAYYNQEQVISSLENIREKIDQAIEGLNLSKLCVAFELPVLGYLTRLEAVHFINYHTQRHIHQLKNIRKALTEMEHH
jgi:hypothetical protein